MTDRDGTGLYFTNGVFLYRVVGVAASDMGDIVELEDCYLLDVMRVPIREFRERCLRVVTAVPARDCVSVRDRLGIFPADHASCSGYAEGRTVGRSSHGSRTDRNV